MTATVRTLARLVGTHLGLNATPFAARLVRDGWLPRRDDEVDADDAAILLAAILAGPEPAMAAERGWTPPDLRGLPVIVEREKPSERD